MAREYPDRPVVGVGAVVVQDDRVLIVKRAHDPRKGEWSLPGGQVELGESLVAAVQREVREETGIDVAVGPIIDTFDRIHRHDGRVRYHFVIVDYLCTCTGGSLCAGDDAEDARWVSGDEIAGYGVAPLAADIIRRGLALAAAAPP